MKLPKIMSLAAVSLASVFLLTSCTAAPATSTTETVYTTPAVGSMFEVDGATAKITGTAGDYILTISDADNDMTWFTDRPMREAGNTQTSSLPSLWTEGGVDSFENTPPNATLTVKNNGKSETFVGELSQPTFDGSSLSFKVKPIEEISSSLVGKTLSNPVLVIDSSASSFSVSVTNDVSNFWSTSSITIVNTSGTTYPSGATFTINLSNQTSTYTVSPMYPLTSASYSNGVITAVATESIAPNQSLSLSGSASANYTAELASCTSSVGTCTIG